ncbi:hypothetical protein IWQ62_002882 [Dispira parvispora]|uniref:SCP domain-containing protein n=1 Tax=Dispira parvispora TaxID=1520584 RepID=A0A9W8E720_9FUNG|nr:hypothetical protein IWQ62_002882 [Dispira parvispora]
MKYLVPLTAMLLLASSALAAPPPKCKPKTTESLTDIPTVTTSDSNTFTILPITTPGSNETTTTQSDSVTTDILPTTTPGSEETATTDTDRVTAMPITTPGSNETATTQSDSVTTDILPTTTPSSDETATTDTGRVTAMPITTDATTSTSTTSASEETSTTSAGDGGDFGADTEKILSLVNEQRAKKGVKALKLNNDLNKVSLDHSNYQLKIGKMTHDDASGTLSERLSNANVKWSSWGENVALGQKTEESVMESWVKSPGHYANIIGEGYNAVGIARAGDYWTQTFANVA